MPVKTWAKKFLDAQSEKESPEQHKLAKFLETDVRDEEDAGYLNVLIEKAKKAAAE